MRSSRSVPDPLDPGPAGFCHRGLHGPDPFVENSLKAFAAALEMGAGIEADVRLTGDGVPVVFHDQNTRRLTGIDREVARTTLKDLPPIPTLADLLDLADGKVPILLELKVAGNAVRLGEAAIRALKGRSERTAVMSFHPGVMAWLRWRAPALRRGLVVRDSLPRLGRWLAMVIADPDFLAVETAAAERAWVARARKTHPVYCWTVKTARERERIAPLVDALIWEADGRPGA